MCFPLGTDNESSRSGTPDILAVKRIDPYAKAERARPEGARITDSVSMISM